MVECMPLTVVQIAQLEQPGRKRARGDGPFWLKFSLQLSISQVEMHMDFSLAIS